MLKVYFALFLDLIFNIFTLYIFKRLIFKSIINLYMKAQYDILTKLMIYLKIKIKSRDFNGR